MHLISEQDLKEWCGYKRRADLEAFLKRHRIPFHYGAGNRICTTFAAVENSLALTDNPAPASKYRM